MSISKRHCAIALTALLTTAATALAQRAGPQVGYVYPAGAKQGATTEVIVAGQFLMGVRSATVSGDGVTATVVEYVRPIPRRQLNQLRERSNLLRKRMQELRKKTPGKPRRTPPKPAAKTEKAEKAAKPEKKPAPAERKPGAGKTTPKNTGPDPETMTLDQVMKEMADIREKTARFYQRTVTPAVSETVRVKVTVAADARPGQREIRLATPRGVTNPLVFCVGQLPEFSETPCIEVTDLTVLRGAGRFGQQTLATPSPEMKITLPAVVNGQVLPGQTDRFRFTAAKGQRIVVAARARDLVPYLADAVPGWFQAAVGLYDADHNELAFADHFRFHADPAFCCTIPADGEYVLQVRDVIYRGRDDFVYRITVGEVPFVTGIFPLGCRAGARATVEVAGWNLPVTQLVHDAPVAAVGRRSLVVRRGDLVSNPALFAVGDLPEVREAEPNDAPANAQPVTLPVVVNGRVTTPGRWDVFRFEGKAGDEVVAEVHARRLGSPLDSLLRLTDAAGRTLAANDDCMDTASGLNTHHADSYVRLRLPADGTYFVHLGDTQGRGGPAYGYRLRISAPRPDFALRIVPSGMTVRAGWSAPVTLQVIRKDGYAGAINLTLKDAPAGFALSGARVPAKADTARFTLTAPPGRPGAPARLTIEGRADVAGRRITRPAVPAEDRMQAFLWRHLVPADDLTVALLGSPAPRANARILSPTPVVIPAGGSVRVRVGLPIRTRFGQVRFELNNPPEGIALGGVRPAPGGSEIIIRSNAAKAKPGLEGNLIITVHLTPNRPASQPAGRRRRVRRFSPGTLPAIPFKVAAKEEATARN